MSSNTHGTNTGSALPPDWPNASFSRRASIDGLEVHYQLAGSGAPVLLLLHGTGASVHSWRDLLPLLAPHATIIAPDLPGHGFTTAPPRGSYAPQKVGRLVARLLDELELEVDAVAGHSAGAVVASQMILDRHIAPRVLFALNPALLPPFGMQLVFFRLLARGFADSAWLPDVVARRARRPDVVGELLRSVGTRLDADGNSLYAELLSRPDHVRGVLRLMAEWDLDTLVPRLKHLRTRTFVVSGGRDVAVPRRVINRLRIHLPEAEYIELAEAGHLTHEEMPDAVAALMMRELASSGILDGQSHSQRHSTAASPPATRAEPS